MRHRHAWLAFVVFLGLAVALTWPLISVVSTGVPSDPGDPLLNTWILWWNHQATPFTDAWWNAPAFYPSPGTLALSEHLIGLAWLTTPVQWLGGGAQLAYNLAFLLSFPLAALAAYLLCHELTGRRDAALVAGLAFGFSPYRIAHLSHLQILSSYGMPIALLGLHRYVRERRVRWLALFAGAWLLQGLANGYYLLFFSVLVWLWLAWFPPPGRRVHTVGATLMFWLPAALVLIPVLTRYRAVHQAFGLRRSIGELQVFSADVASVLDAAPLLACWGFLRVIVRPEGELFPGVTVLAITAIGGAIAFATRRQEPDPASAVRTLPLALAGVTALFCVAALAATVGPWRVRLFGLTISLSRPDRPLAVALLFALAWMCTSSSVVAAYRRRSMLAFYLLAMGVMWLLSLGPSPTLMGERLLYRAPYALLSLLPGFDSARVPARFAMLAILCLSIASGLAFAVLARRLGKGRVPILLAACAGIVADGWTMHMPIIPAPERWRVEEAAAAAEAVLELPLGDPFDDVATMYRGMSHRRPVINGYSGYSPPAYTSLREGLRRLDPSLLWKLAVVGAIDVVFSAQDDQSEEWTRYVTSYPGATRVSGEEGRVAYRLPAAARAELPHEYGPPIRIERVTAAVDAEHVGNLTDGDLASRWSAGRQTEPLDLQLDLGASRRIRAVVLSLGPYPKDFPCDLLVELSADGETWSRAWRGGTAGLAYAAALAEPTRVPMTIDLGDQSARFVRLAQVGVDPVAFWSVAELAVLSPPSP